MIEEVLRRLRNCDPAASWEERGGHITAFAISMKSSGHTEAFRKMIFSKAVARYCKELDANNAGEVDIYRSREERQRQIELKGGRATKDSWFRKVESDGERVSSVFRVPFTPHGALKGAIMESLANYKAPKGLKTKIQEDGEAKLVFKLVKSDPFPREQCGRSTCPITCGEQHCRDQCFQAHSNYAILCNRCDPPSEVALARPVGAVAARHASAPAAGSTAVPGTDAALPAAEAATPDVDGATPAANNVTTPATDAAMPTADAETPAAEKRPPSGMYLGETARGCNTRFKEHVRDYTAENPKGFMWEHVVKAHDSVRGAAPGDDFYMKLCAVDRDPIRRVVRESVRIKNAREREDEGGGTEVWNSKNEWFGVKVVTVDLKQE